MTVTLSAAASLFTVRSSFFTAPPPASGRGAASPVAAGAAHGVEPVASAAARGGLPAGRRADPSGSSEAEAAIPSLSSLALELSRRAAGASFDVPCPLTVPPPVVH